MMTSDRRLPAEWEAQSGVLMAWPHRDTDWAEILPEVTECYADIIAKISAVTAVTLVGPARECEAALKAAGLDANRRVRFIDIPTNDTWARDFGPVTVETPEGPLPIDFKFNGWGLKFAADRDNLINRALTAEGVLPRLENRLSFVLEGGSIESDGRGTVMTTSECLLSPNRNGGLSRQQIEHELMEALGAERVLWVDHGALSGDDTDSHIDTLARFVDHDTIVYVGAGDPADPDHEGLAAMLDDLRALRTAEGQPYHLVELPLPDPIYDDDGMKLPATYANFLISNGTVFMPTYGQMRKDTLAAMTLQSVMPYHRIVTADCRALIKQHGSLHCITMNLPEGL